MKIDIVPMDISHVDQVLIVEESCFSIPWSKDDFLREILENNMAVYFVALADDVVVGYAGMWHVINEGHITNVAVLHDFRRLGIANMFLQKFFDVAEDRELIGITLEVRINNSPAQKLYSNWGFRPEGIRKNYYSDTKEDAVIMWKYFPIYEDFDPDIHS